ncbi:MAG TPA: hypothetical protein VHF25_01185, partial [Nitriliruptorales bacterium]|nr:hypothetical protein [Nitriliruptorales bacterium]
MRRLALVAGATALTLAACGGEAALEADRPAALNPPPAEVAQAPLEADVAGATVRAQARAWRDVQPYAGGGGLPRCANLCAVIDLVAVDGRDLRRLEVEELWAVRDDGAGEFERLVVREVSGGLEVTGRRGPRTEAGRRITLVVGLAGPGGTVAYARTA